MQDKGVGWSWGSETKRSTHASAFYPQPGTGNLAITGSGLKRTCHFCIKVLPQRAAAFSLPSFSPSGRGARVPQSSCWLVSMAVIVCVCERVRSHPLSSEVRPWQLRLTEGEAGKAASSTRGRGSRGRGITPPEWRTPSQALEAALCVGPDPSSSARGSSRGLKSWRKPWDPGAAVPAPNLLLGGAPG